MILIDTGPLVAIFNARDEQHEACVKTIASLKPPLWTCWPVITEATYMLEEVPGAITKLFAGFNDNIFKLHRIDDDSLIWIQIFMQKYTSINAQLADATLCYLAERENIRTIFTLDRRDFGIYRLKGDRRLKIIPS